MHANLRIKNALRAFAIYISTIFIFYLLFSKINLKGILIALGNINLEFLTIALLVSIIINIFLASDLRRKLLILFKCNLSFREALFIKMGTMPLKLIPGFKYLDLIQASYLKENYGMPFSTGIFLNILAYLISVVALLIVFLLGFVFYWLFMPLKFGVIYKEYILIPVIIAILSLLLFFVFFLNRRILLLIKRNTTSKRSWLHEAFNKLANLLLNTPKRKIIFLVLYASVFQSSELIVFYILSKSLSINIPFFLIMLYMPLSILISNLPIVVLGLGIREATILALFSRYGPIEDILGLGILVSFVEHIFPILLGFFFFVPLINKLRIQLAIKQERACL
ncbi:MAG: lysylphosphatidylglycerol synthase transmembrane domain-containing protein [Candidatus Omnitrophica bacterium]|nr:lysylphosphatidylglycerol synthase transmembrane domain-containing protein [Candidatus Omnitrophota bacterium]